METVSLTDGLILSTNNNGRTFINILLHLSEAFDTMDHRLLLVDCLRKLACPFASSFKWFYSTTNCLQRVMMSNYAYMVKSLICVAVSTHSLQPT